MSMKRAFWVAGLLLIVSVACGPERESGQVLTLPVTADYYANVRCEDPALCRQVLHDLIDDHQFIAYSSSTETDTWDMLEAACQDPRDSTRVLDVYKNESYAKVGGGNPIYNREHTWPKSYGFRNYDLNNYPYTDGHHLFISNSSYNSLRANLPFRSCASDCSEAATVNTASDAANSNWFSGKETTGSWQTWMARRGDVARALLYMDLRYAGGVHGVTGAFEPDLVLTDDQKLITASKSGLNASGVAYMGSLSVLLTWHEQDPVDDIERRHNAQVYAFQGNRNPFVDHPEWVDCVYKNKCQASVLPPMNVSAKAGYKAITLGWSTGGGSAVAHYTVYRATQQSGPYVAIANPTATSYVDSGLDNGVDYYYAVTATGKAGNRSVSSVKVSAAPVAPWINELHYDNISADADEAVEIAGPTGLDLTGWSLVGYNGRNGRAYKTVALSGSLSGSHCRGFSAVVFKGMQNGAPDGLALVDPQGVVVQFLSYEGAMIAQDGPAATLLSTPIPVRENGSTPLGFSLQLAGQAAHGADFEWQPQQAATFGLPNTGQTFECP
jgi:endonuclease I